MKKSRMLSLLVSTSLAGLLAIAPAWAGDSHAGHNHGLQSLTLESGDIHEACIQLTPPQLLHYAFTATGELAFNIHYHANHKAFYPLAEHPTLQADTTFIPESGQHYCLMWTNRGNSAVELSLQQDILNKPE